LRASRRARRRLVPDAVAAPGRRARRRADRVLIDSTRHDAATAFQDCLEPSRRNPVTDLAWVRLQPWRQLLVHLLSGTAFGAFTSGVRRIESEGDTGQRFLLAGWMMNRLGQAPDVVRVIDAEQPTLHLWAEHDGPINWC
jgi:glucose-6-phosphate dehydrogenase assembly protein OpcA